MKYQNSSVSYLVPLRPMTPLSTRIEPDIDASWKNVLIEDFNSKSFVELKEFLLDERSKHKVYPPGKQIFSAFNFTPFDEVKVVILGQDPYHGPGQAHGLCFSVAPGIRIPPSLVNIYKELHDDTGVSIPSHGNLENWARQGVLLLNATLTVRASQAGSHQGKGWEEFTDSVIRKLSAGRSHIVFMLWGRYAQAKEVLIDQNKHLVLRAAHPSPFSAHNGFLGCKHFTKANDYLEAHSISPVDWDLSGRHEG